MIVPPDGPVPCDLAVCGEAPGAAECEAGCGFVGPSGRMLWKRDEGDFDLMALVAQRPRESCYVTNVCKEPMPDEAWRALTQAQRDTYCAALREELLAVQPRLVLAFGTRAARSLIADFTTMTACHGIVMAGPAYWVMPLWHPAAYLRGNKSVLGELTADLAKVPAALVALDGMEPFLRVPQLVPEWPAEIGFLKLGKKLKTGRCLLCGGGDVSSYSGDGLTWKLCKVHAATSAEWARGNLASLLEHRDIAVADAATSKMERAAGRMETALREGNERRLNGGS